MNTTSNENQNGTYEMKQTFLANAITDISSNVQLIDTKVSIIMAAVVAITVGLLSGYDNIIKLFSSILPCSWRGVALLITAGANAASLLCIFIFGILTIRGHSSNVSYHSKWFFCKATKEYSLDSYKSDIWNMSERDIIENMAVELYKLNDINRQKLFTCKWTLRFFTSYLVTLVLLFTLLMASVL